MVLADGIVFKGSVRDNLLLKHPGATEEEIGRAIEAAGLRRMLERLTDGLDTEIGEHGVGLSVGERQRIQIARVLIASPRILLLDEATANLDYGTEADVRKSMMALRDRTTIIIIAHRYSMVRDADQVIVLEKGRVAARGTPEEVKASNEWFRNMAESAR
jgi:ATP-binding cassette, subfamily B, bacterial